MKIKWLLPLLLLVPPAALAQQSAAPAAYQIKLTLYQHQAGKAETAHVYILNATPGSPATLRAGDKIPVETGSAGLGSRQFTYDPVGIIIVCTLPSSPAATPEGNLAMKLRVEVSAVVPSANGTVSSDPVFRNAQADVSTVVPLGKPTTVADFSDIGHEMSYRVEVLATPLP